MRKLFFGAILGAVAMYFLDPERGDGRRQRLSGLWSSRRETVLDAARTTAGAVSGVSQGIGSRVGDVLPQGDASTNGQGEPSGVGRQA